MKNINAAKRSVAMKCCIKLHQLGLLMDDLRPLMPSAILEEKGHLFPNWVNENDSLCGTYKKKRRHNLEVGLCFTCSE